MSTDLPAATPLSQFHAEDGVWSGTVTNDDGTPADLTASGCTLVFTLAKSPGQTAILAKDLSAGITGYDDGSYQITIPQADIDSQAQGARLSYDMIYTRTTGASPKTVLWGSYTLAPSVGG